MPLLTNQQKTLFQLLQDHGWQLCETRIVAPNESIWLYRETPWVGSGKEFLDQMRVRLDRIIRVRDAELDEYENCVRSYDDTVSLIACLEAVYGE